MRVLSSAKLFSEHFEVHEELLLNICDGDENLLWNHDLAKEDSSKKMYMTMNERIHSMCADVAQQTGNKNAIQEYKKKEVYFGYL